MIKTKGFVVGLALSFTATKLLQRGCIEMNYETFQEGEWVLYARTENAKREFGFVLEDMGGLKVKVQMVNDDTNTHNSDQGYKYRMIPRELLKRSVDTNCRMKVEQFLQPYKIDFLLATRNKEEFEKYMKGDAVE